jgi:hypothetical protein
MLGSVNGKGGSTKRQEGTVIHAALFPSPSETSTDLFGADLPLLGILCVLLVLKFQGCKLKMTKNVTSSCIRCETITL